MSKTAKNVLEKSLKGSSYGFRHSGPACFEVWCGARYVCMLTCIDNLWGATHNMHPDKSTRMHSTPLEAINYYERLLQTHRK